MSSTPRALVTSLFLPVPASDAGIGVTDPIPLDRHPWTIVGIGVLVCVCHIAGFTNNKDKVAVPPISDVRSFFVPLPVLTRGNLGQMSSRGASRALSDPGALKSLRAVSRYTSHTVSRSAPEVRVTSPTVGISLHAFEAPWQEGVDFSFQKYFKFSTPDGHDLCKRIITEEIGYAPHDYQLEGVCRALDGVDLLAITPTGSGKTGFLVMYLVAMRAILRKPALCPNPPAHFKSDAVMIVVCPTLALEEDMDKKFTDAKLSTLVINKTTSDEVRRSASGKDIWEQASDAEVLLLSPEQLASSGFEGLLLETGYQDRVVSIAVDEVHLLNSWGRTIRRDFEQIGFMRARIRSKPTLIALTATLRAGKPLLSVCHFLGLHAGQFHLIRRSNMRYDLRFVFRTVQSSARSHTFTELDWILSGTRRTIIFCPTIALAFRVATYLHARAAGLEDLSKRVRIYHSLNWASYNTYTLSSMRSDDCSRVTVATDALAVGIDVPTIDDVVLYDTTLPADTDVILQKAGRIRDGRERHSKKGSRPSGQAHSLLL
ncbi:hypothetical protein NUW54_g10818 [Trametes sanguinea]|uniref:Uncharacterized protein n=1 Tax=Trametes sanguinea TaxID=158606 RepID=A0ACC1NTS4_9APHY|nr:hypothetical protein NUW54_g10818 [Trametes sanguinea]